MEMVKIPVFVSVQLGTDGKPHYTAWSCKMHGQGFHHVLETAIEFPSNIVPELVSAEVARLREEIKKKQATCEAECVAITRQINNLLAIEMEPRDERSPS